MYDAGQVAEEGQETIDPLYNDVRSGLSRTGKGTHKVRVASALEKHAQRRQEDGESVSLTSVDNGDRLDIGH